MMVRHFIRSHCMMFLFSITTLSAADAFCAARTDADAKIRKDVFSGTKESAAAAATPEDWVARPSSIAFRKGMVETELRDAEQAMSTLLRLGADEDTKRHIVVQFTHAVTEEQRALLKAAGVHLQSYLGGQSHAYFAAVNPRLDTAAISRVGSLGAALEIQDEWKLHPQLLSEAAPHWLITVPRKSEFGDTNDSKADTPADPDIAVYILFHPDVPLEAGAGLVPQHGGMVVSHIRSVNGVVVEMPFSQVSFLAGEDSVLWIEPALPPLTHQNDDVRVITESEDAQAPPYQLDGTGVTVLVYDGGTARLHLDLIGRLNQRDGSIDSDHATHVACTIGGSGENSSGQYRGMAPGVMIESYGFQRSNNQGIFLYTNPGDIEEDYDEAINTWGVDISNNSIGTNTCDNGFPCAITGDYGVTAQLIDAIVAGSLGSPTRIVWANGNERSQGTGCVRCVATGDHTPEGYHSTAPPACAKNHITVGALMKNDEATTSFSSWGPTDDGRIKPDVAAPGSQTYSCYGSTYYLPLSGTSMAAPAVTGAASLLLEDYRAQFPDRPNPRNSTLKVLLAHTAKDIYERGPDYKSGFGSIKIRQAIDFMRNDAFMEEELVHNGIYTKLVYVSEGATPFKATLAWDDVPGTPNVSPALVNDLDLRVYDPSGDRRLSWTLDPDDPSRPAVQTQEDHTNNIEQVAVESPEPGLWRVEVFGYNIPEGPQVFSLALSPLVSGDCNQNDLIDLCDISCGPDGGFCDVPGCGLSEDCSGNGIPDECEPDCNANDVPDSCDIIYMTSQDLDEDGLPDECEFRLSVPSDYPTIQDAIDAAEPGDIVELEPGVYSGPGNRDIQFQGKPLVVTSIQGPEQTIIDCQRQGRAFIFPSETEEARPRVVYGITIQNGFYNGLGGGIFCAGSPSIINCVFRENSVPTHQRGGGAIYFLDSEASLIGCIISENTAGNGGGVYVDRGRLSIQNCTIAYNRAGIGGGLFLSGGDHQMQGCIVWGNSATEGSQIGLAQLLARSGAFPADLNVDYSDIQGGAGDVYFGSLEGATLHYGAANINADPRFQLPPKFGNFRIPNYHLCVNSPCIDAGNPDKARVSSSLDIDGQPRIQGIYADMGADEYLVDCNRNDIPDATELVWGLAADCNQNGVPDTCDLSPLNGRKQVSGDCNENGIPDECEDVPCIECDINEDGRVNASDRSLLQSCISEPTPDLCRRADINGDNKINSIDLAAWLPCQQSEPTALQPATP